MQKVIMNLIQKAIENMDSEKFINLLTKHPEKLEKLFGIFPFENGGKLAVILLILQLKVMLQLKEYMPKLNDCLDEIEINADVLFFEDSREHLKARFLEYLRLKILRENLKDFSEQNGYKDEDWKRIIKNQKEISIILSEENNLLNHLKQITSSQLKKLVNNDFYDTEESKMREKILMTNEVREYAIDKNDWTDDEFYDLLLNFSNDRLNRIGKTIFSEILTDFDIPKKKNSKSIKKRLLFPLFQITHPIRCQNEEIWKKTRKYLDNEPTSWQSYKAYQVTTISKIIGDS